MSTNEELYRQRLSRYLTAMRNEKPDRIPIRPFVTGFTPKYADLPGCGARLQPRFCCRPKMCREYGVYSGGSIALLNVDAQNIPVPGITFGKDYGNCINSANKAGLCTIFPQHFLLMQIENRHSLTSDL